MKKTLRPKSILTLSVVLLVLNCAHPVFAEPTNTTTNTTVSETTPADKTTEDTTPLPPVVDVQPEPSYGPKTADTITDTTTDTATRTSTDSDSNQVEPEQQPEPEPQSDPQIDNPETSQVVTSTPQPPILDAQQKSASTAEENDTTEQSKDLPEADTSATPSQSTPSQDKPAQTDETSQTEESDDQITQWRDTHPKQVNADWLQLRSGEWLRGRVVSMQKNSLEFESDELKNLDIDWKKVKYIISHEPFSLRFDDEITAIGAIEITQDKVFVVNDYEDLEFDRDKLLIIASGKDTELSLWSSKITLSLNARRGNTNQTDFNAAFDAKRRTLLSRLNITYAGNFTNVEESETINNHRLNSTYDIFITRYYFWTLVSAEYYRDPFQNIDRRINVNTALGYTLINNKETEWDISAGPGYQETRYVSVLQGSSSDNAVVLILNTNFDTALNSKVDLEGTYIATIGDSKTGNYTQHSRITIETEVTNRLDFDVTLVWDRTRDPVPDEDNVTPEQDDFRLLFGLGFDL